VLAVGIGGYDVLTSDRASGCSISLSDTSYPEVVRKKCLQCKEFVRIRLVSAQPVGRFGSANRATVKPISTGGLRPNVTSSSVITTSTLPRVWS
jgi:hypothetical protein